jgi:hypothetical protein
LVDLKDPHREKDPCDNQRKWGLIRESRALRTPGRGKYPE